MLVQLQKRLPTKGQKSVFFDAGPPSGPVVDSSMHAVGLSDFRSHFRCADTQVQLDADQQLIPWEWLYDLFSPSPGIDRAALIHYGKVDDAILLGLTPAGLTPAATQPDPQGTWYDYVEEPANFWCLTDKGFNQNIPKRDWEDQYMENYFRSTEVVRRPGTGFVKLSRNRDARLCAIGWESEILRMYQENWQGSTPDPKRTEVVFSCISFEHSSADGGLAGFRHGMALHLRIDGVDCLDSTQWMILYWNKAADLGSLCPPRCGRYFAMRLAP